MLDYETQLLLKRDVVIKAYQEFSGEALMEGRFLTDNLSELSQQEICDVHPTMPSPKQYAYRTKITPHFDIAFSRRKGKAKEELTHLDIGFNESGSRKVLDIEECPIATNTLNDSLGPIRAECKGFVPFQLHFSNMIMVLSNFTEK